MATLSFGDITGCKTVVPVSLRKEWRKERRSSTTVVVVVVTEILLSTITQTEHGGKKKQISECFHRRCPAKVCQQREGCTLPGKQCRGH